MITLSEEQNNAVKQIVNFILHPYPKIATKDTIVYSLVGSAGVGKTTVVKEILNAVKSKVDIKLIAPTHKAANVLATMCGHETITLHSLLGLRPDLSLENFDARWIKYKRKFTTEEENSVFIIDEASMINDELFDYLLKLARDNQCKILFISDAAQLKPVKSKYKSKIYSCVNTIILNKVFRQSEENPLLKILTYLREKSIPKFRNSFNDNGGLVVYPKKDLFVSKAAECFKQTNNIKILAYTNEQVSSYNKEVFNKLFPNSTTPFPVGCILTGYNNIKKGNLKIITNSMDYIVLESVKKSKTYKSIVDDVTSYNISGYNLKVKELVNGQPEGVVKEIFIGDIDNKQALELGKELEARREYGISTSNWNSFYTMQNNLLTTRNWVFNNRVINTKNIDYGYAMTVHKSQSSTYDAVFIDMKDINIYTINKEIDRQQLQYVAMSRTKKYAFVLWY